MNICVYCSSSELLERKYFDLGYAVGKAIGLGGHNLVYGGYYKGIMAEVARGVKENGGMVCGVVPKVFQEYGVNRTHLDQLVLVESMHDRKKKMEELSDLFVILPGGIGTMDEFFEVFVLKSLGELAGDILLLNFDGFYDELLNLLRNFQDERFLTYKTMEVVEIIENIDVFIDRIREVQ